MAILFGVLPLLLAVAAWAGPQTASAESILTGPAPGPCAGALAGADYVGGTDAYGNPVTPADLPGRVSVHLDSDAVYPVIPGATPGSKTVVKVTAKGLSTIVNAPAGCSPQR